MLRTAHRTDGTQRHVHLKGWHKQSNDQRDETFRVKLPGSFLTANPATCDNRGICSPIEDQGDEGSCTAHMLTSMVEANEIRDGAKGVRALLGAEANPQVTISSITTASDGTITFLTTIKPVTTPTPAPTPTPTPTKKLIHASRQFQYYATRKIEGTTNYDSGATIRNAIKAAALYGCVDESLWPYDISKMSTNPPQPIWTEALRHKVTSYHAITDGDLNTMKSVLVSGYLIGFGFTVYDYMLGDKCAKTGILPYPGKNESIQGGHAVVLVGYDDNKAMPNGTKGAFLVRNSWGTGWGVKGYFWMGYDYVGDTKLSSDFWVVKSQAFV